MSAVIAVVLGPAATLARGQSTPPVSATIFFQTFTPLTIVLQLQTTQPVITAAGFSQSDFWRRLFFTTPTGGTITNASEALIHKDSPVLFCFSRQRVLQTPTALPVVAAQTLPGPPNGFSTQFVISVQQFYSLTQAGRYTVNARIPLQTFTTSDPTAVITDCDQFPGQTVVHVAANTGRQSFTVVSNSLEFVLSQFVFNGFLSPVLNDSACAAPPCKSYAFGSTIPLKFRLSSTTGSPVTTATATLSVSQLSGSPPLLPPVVLGVGAGNPGNQFRLNPGAGQYGFDLNTGVLSLGVWRLEAHLSDGSTQSVQIRLR